MRGADLLAKTLSAAGIQKIFTLSGNQIMPVFDACLDADLELLHVRQEAAAVHMADAWGRLTGQPGIALVTAGPGFANTLTGLYVAKISESPMVLLSGHAPLGQLGKGAFQEMPQAEMASHVSKASWTAQSASGLADDIHKAFDIATSGRPGPVHIALPFNVIDGEVDSSEDVFLRGAFEGSAQRVIDDSAAEQVLGHLRDAKKPLILAGSMMMRGDGPSVLANLSEATGVPVVQMESPRGTNDPVLGAFAEVLAEADLVMLLGKKLDFTVKMGGAPDISLDCRFVQIDPEQSVIDMTRRNVGDPVRLVVGVEADPLPSARRLIELVTGTGSSTEWADEVTSAISYRPPLWSELKSNDDDPLHSYEVTQAIQKYLDEDPNSVFISDGGEWGQWAQACITAPTRIINGPAGSIGTSIPFAIAASLARPGARVVTVLGDGTAGFHVMEYDSAVRYDIPFIAVLGNDAAWNAEYQIQLREYGDQRLIGCELLPSRYDRVVEALGGHGEHVTAASGLAPALERAGASERPALLNVMIGRDPAPVVRRNMDTPQTSSATLH
jgi:acetolactate synthase-1/2/3 large subunit